MSCFDPQAYGLVLAPLLATDRNRPLDAGEPNSDLYTQLSALTVDSAFDASSVEDRAMAEACLAGVWLLHDELDESHTISQSISNATGSYWHAIMHRREGDFSNSKYWFRNVGDHPAFEPLATRTADLAMEHNAVGVLPAGPFPSHSWDPFAFVDLVQGAVAGRNDHAAFARAVQQAEWETLFDYCYREAVDE